MSWEDILKQERKSKEEMIREMWNEWFYSDVESYEERNFEMYSDGSLAGESRSFGKIIRRMRELDPIKDGDKIGLLFRKLEDHPMMPMESLGYPYYGSPDEFSREELEEAYEEAFEGYM